MNSTEGFIKAKFVPPDGDLFLDYGPQLPTGYGNNFLYLLVRDPECVFLYWEVTEDTKGNKPALFIRDITRQTRQQIPIDGFIGSWYAKVQPETIYEAEVGYFEDDVFKSIYKSNRAKTPRKMPSDAIDKDWQPTSEELE